MNAPYYLEDYEPPTVTIWQRINRLLWVVLVLAIVALIIGAFLPQLDRQREERQKQDDLRRSINEQTAIRDHLKNEVDWLTNEPSYLAVFARDKLNKMREGETILLVDPAKDPVIQPGPITPPAGQLHGKSKGLN